MSKNPKLFSSLVLLLFFIIAALGSSCRDKIATTELADGRVEKRLVEEGAPPDSQTFVQRGMVNNKGNWNGVVETYKYGKLFSKTEYSAGLKNGLEVFYDDTGKRIRCVWVQSMPWFATTKTEVIPISYESSEEITCPNSGSSLQYVTADSYDLFSNSYASYYEALNARGAWVIDALAWEGYNSESLLAFLNALEAEITAANPTRVNFNTIYSKALNTLQDTEAHDLLYDDYRALQQRYAADIALGWPLRLAILDRYRMKLSSTFEVLENSYDFYLVRMQSYGATLSDMERVVNEIDSRLDQMNQMEPLDVNDKLFPFKIDERILMVMSAMDEEEFDFGTVLNGILVDGGMNNIWADPLRTAVHDATFGEPISPLVSINPGVGGSVRIGDSDPACDKPCMRNYATGDLITLTAIPNAGHQFLGWEGQCTDAAFACSFEAENIHPVLAHFIPISEVRFLLQVSKTGSGNGTVVSTSPAGIDCGTDCSEEYNQDQLVTLKATAAAGNSFAGWSGACAGTGSCQVTMNAAKTVTATFNVAPPFNDVPASSWAYGYIHAIRDAGITTGCGNNNYCPSNFVTRDQMAAFLVRAIEGDPQTDLCAAGSPFSDVAAGAWYCSHVKRLVEQGITAGCGKDQYCPGNMVTRDQMAAFIVRSVAGEPPQDYCGGVAPFNDVSASAWSCGYIKKLVELGITQGCGNGNYCPGANVNREQMAAFLARAFLDMD